MEIFLEGFTNYLLLLLYNIQTCTFNPGSLHIQAVTRPIHRYVYLSIFVGLTIYRSKQALLSIYPVRILLSKMKMSRLRCNCCTWRHLREGRVESLFLDRANKFCPCVTLWSFKAYGVPLSNLASLKENFNDKNIFEFKNILSELKFNIFKKR